MPRRGRGRFPGAARAHKHEDARGAIHTYVALQHAHSERALALLRDVGAAVQGLMRRHHWRTSRALTQTCLCSPRCTRAARTCLAST